MGLGFLNPGCDNCACDWTRSWYAKSCTWVGPADVVNYLNGTVFDFGVITPELLETPPSGFLGGAAASEGGAFYGESTLELDIDLVHTVEQGESPPGVFEGYSRIKIRYYGFQLTLAVAHTVQKPNLLAMAVYLNYRFSVQEVFLQGWRVTVFPAVEPYEETYTTGTDWNQGSARTGLVPGLRGLAITNTNISPFWQSRTHCCEALKRDAYWTNDFLARPWVQAWNTYFQAIPRYHPPGSALGVGFSVPLVGVAFNASTFMQLSHNAVFQVACNQRPLFSVLAEDSLAATLTETNSPLSTSGTLTVRDADTSDTVTVEVLSVQASGDTGGLESSNAELLSMLTLTPEAPATLAANPSDQSNLEWEFDSGSETFDYLNVNQNLFLRYLLRATDNNNQFDQTFITVTINGSNDIPVITVEDGDTDSVGLSETNTTLVTSGTLTVYDLDLLDVITPSVESVSASGDIDGLESTNEELLEMLTVGPASIEADPNTDTRNFDWNFDSGEEYFDYLGLDEQLVLRYVVHASDGSASDAAHTITITITGTNDVPTISVEASDTNEQTLYANGVTLQTDGTLTAIDLDKTDELTASVVSVVASGDTIGLESTNAELLAMLSVNSDSIAADKHDQSNLQWEFDSGSEHFDYLGTGDQLVLTYTIRVTDPHGVHDDQTVVLTIEPSLCPDPTDYEELGASFDWNPILPDQPYNWGQTSGVSHVVDWDNVTDISVTGEPTNSVVYIGDESYPSSVVISHGGVTNTPGTYNVTISGVVASGEHEGCLIEFSYSFTVDSE